MSVFLSMRKGHLGTKPVLLYCSLRERENEKHQSASFAKIHLKKKKTTLMTWFQGFLDSIAFYNEISIHQSISVKRKIKFHLAPSGCCIVHADSLSHLSKPGPPLYLNVKLFFFFLAHVVHCSGVSIMSGFSYRGEVNPCQFFTWSSIWRKFDLWISTTDWWQAVWTVILLRESPKQSKWL